MATAHARNPYHAQPGYHAEVDIEKGASLAGFADSLIRQAFIRKVFGLLAVQLALTTVIAGSIVFSTATKAFLAGNSWIIALCFFTTIGVLLAMTFSEKARHSHPTNLILLTIFTAAEGVIVGAASAHYATSLVVTAFAITAGVTTGLCIYALRTKEDFTAAGGMLYSCLLVLMIASFVGIFFRTPIVNLAISTGGALLFSAYIVYDVQMLMGGEHQQKISPDEYVFAAVAIYLDIINLFLYILRILNQMRGDQ